MMTSFVAQAKFELGKAKWVSRSVCRFFLIRALGQKSPFSAIFSAARCPVIVRLDEIHFMKKPAVSP
jgi:hypothetical protein